MKPAQYRAVAAAAMSEDELLEQVRGIARRLNWRTYHTHRSDRSESGFPDLVLVRGRQVLWRELKDQRRKPTRAQRDFLASLEEAGQDVGIWRPSDLLSGRIVAELERVDVDDEQLIRRVAIAICPARPGGPVGHEISGHGECESRARAAVAVMRDGGRGGS